MFTTKKLCRLVWKWTTLTYSRNSNTKPKESKEKRKCGNWIWISIWILIKNDNNLKKKKMFKFFFYNLQENIPNAKQTLKVTVADVGYIFAPTSQSRIVLASLLISIYVNFLSPIGELKSVGMGETHHMPYF